MGHGHDHAADHLNDRKLIAAIALNGALTLAQIIGGVLSGSLALIADALHNISDAASLVIALFARKIGRKPPDALKTFGYKRAEIVAALINVTTLILIGTYLLYEAVWRFIQPEPVTGWLMIAVAGVALAIDVVTALLTYAMSKESVNMRAAFIHNLSDALASVGVIIAGVGILLFDWLWIDALMTILIAGYVLWHGITLLPSIIHVLMEGAPPHLEMEQVICAMEEVEGVVNVHHVHLWQLDEHRNALEAHVVSNAKQLSEIESIKADLKTLLTDRFAIAHTTLEFEAAGVSVCTI
ncbi:MAG: cation transporter [Rickettsiales bacterium]|nr:cation transporter [Rickettsiales bacterium]